MLVAPTHPLLPPLSAPISRSPPDDTTTHLLHPPNGHVSPAGVALSTYRIHRDGTPPLSHDGTPRSLETPRDDSARGHRPVASTSQRKLPTNFTGGTKSGPKTSAATTTANAPKPRIQPRTLPKPRPALSSVGGRLRDRIVEFPDDKELLDLLRPRVNPSIFMTCGDVVMIPVPMRT